MASVNLPSVCVHNNTQTVEEQAVKNRSGLTHHLNDVGGCEVDVGG